MCWIERETRARVLAGVLILIPGILGLPDHGVARPPEGFEFMDSAQQVRWYRLQNREIRVDFSEANPNLAVSAVLRDEGIEFVSQESGVKGLWVDRLNGAIVRSSTADMVHPGLEGIEAALKTESLTEEGVLFQRKVRMLPDGANLEIRYRLTNTSSSPMPVRYTVDTAWNPGPEGSFPWYHIPRREEIARFSSDSKSGEVLIPGMDLEEAWYCVDSPENRIGVFFVSSQPMREWKISSPGEGGRTVTVLLEEQTLKPGEWREGKFWIAWVRGIGLPVSAGPKYIAGIAWKMDGRTGLSRPESRLIGMPSPLKKLRIFSAVGEADSIFRNVPKYRRRSRLSNTETVSIPLPVSTRADEFLEVEQSIYSSSENLGYWKVRVKTPATLIGDCMALADWQPGRSLPGLETSSGDPWCLASGREERASQEPSQRVGTAFLEPLPERMETEPGPEPETGEPGWEWVDSAPFLEDSNAPVLELNLPAEFPTDDEKAVLLSEGFRQGR